MAVENGYATVEEIRDQMGDTAARIDIDVIERSIEAASRLIDSLCGQRFWLDPTPVARTFSPVDNLFVFVGGIGSTTGLVVQSDTGGNGTYSETWTLDTDFLLTPPNAPFFNSSAYSWSGIQAVGSKTFIVGARRPSLKVTAKWGWTVVPSDIVKATILQTVRIIRLKDAPFGIAGMGEFGAVRIAKVDPNVESLVRPFYRLTRPDW